MEARAWGRPGPIARFPAPEKRIYAIDDRPPLVRFPFWTWTGERVNFVFPPEQIEFVSVIEAMEPVRPSPHRVVTVFCGPSAPFPEVPTPEEILDSALNLGYA